VCRAKQVVERVAVNVAKSWRMVAADAGRESFARGATYVVWDRPGSHAVMVARAVGAVRAF